METMLIQIGGKKVVVGLSWHALIGRSNEQRELDEICAKHETRFGIVLTHDEVSMVGLSKSPLRGISGAGMVAAGAKGRSLVLLEAVGDDRIWLCAVRNGSPQPGFDVVVHPDKVPELLAQLSEIAEFKVVSSAFEDVDESSDYAALTSGIKPLMVRQLVGVSSAVKLAGVGVLLVLGLGIGGWSLMQQMERQRALDALAMINQAQAESQRREAEAHRLAAVAAAEAAVATRVTALPAPLDQVTNWLGSFDEAPSAVKGWKMAQVKCSSAECQIFWSRTPIGTTSDFIAHAVNSGWRVTSSEFDKITTVVANPSGPAVARNGSARDVPSAETAVPELMTTLQRLSLVGVQSLVKQASPVTSPAQAGAQAAPPPPAGASAANALAAASPWKVGALNLSGHRFFELREAAEFINYPNVSIASMTINFENQTWNMEGTYAVR